MEREALVGFAASGAELRLQRRLGDMSFAGLVGLLSARRVA